MAQSAQGVIVARHDGIVEILRHADPVVKGVMLILLAASIATWSLWIAKLLELRSADAALDHDIALLGNATSMQQVGSVTHPTTGAMTSMVSLELARDERALSRRGWEGVEERVSVQLPMIEAQAIHKMLKGTSIIASIGATAPFIGLAGTVWGIMNSFLGIAQARSASLAVVAPGIAEALMATAVGLAAAIPAVLIYNNLARSIAGFRRRLGQVSVLTACVLSREVERNCPAMVPSGSEVAHLPHRNGGAVKQAIESGAR